MPATEKTCVVCFTKFYARADARFCTPECRSAAVVFQRHPHLKQSPAAGTTTGPVDAEYLREIYETLAEEGFDNVTDALKAVTAWRTRALVAEKKLPTKEMEPAEFNGALDAELKNLGAN